MDQFKENILALIWPDSTLKTLVSDQDIEIPYIDDYHHRDIADDLHYPPFILPFFADFSGPELRGLIVHPFSPKRSVSIVSYDLESDKVVEIARSTLQYVTEMLFDMLGVGEGVNDRIREFCMSVNYSDADIQLVEKFTQQYVENPNLRGYKYLRYFEEDLPLEHIEDLSDYKGDFVSSSKILNSKVVKSSCIFEVYYLQDWLPSLQTEGKLPKWLVPEADLQRLFDEYLGSGQLEQAWFTLNNDQWDLETINKALIRMQAKTDNELFQLLAKSWRTTFGFM